MRILMLVGCLFAVLSACNTVRGVGEDVQQGGKAIQKGATEVQKKL